MVSGTALAAGSGERAISGVSGERRADHGGSRDAPYSVSYLVRNASGG